VHPDIVRARELLQTGEADRAGQVCSQLLAAEPKNSEAFNVLGGIALQSGKNDLAVGYFNQALAIDPGESRFHQGVGIAHYNLGQVAEATKCFRKARALDPNDPAAHNNLGNCYKLARNFSGARRCYRKAVSVQWTYLPAYINLADVLAKKGKLKAAARTYRKALQIGGGNPDNRDNLVLLHHRLGLALRDLEQTDEAILHYREAIALQPDFSPAHNSLGGALLFRNEVQDALACFRKALEINPNYSRVHSNVLLTMNYLAECTPQQIFQESRRYDEQQAKGYLRGRKPFRNVRNKNRVLRIGYLSPDFRDHSVAHFTRSLPGEHDRGQFDVYCYADVESPDFVTRQFEEQADHWLNIADMDDDDVAARVRDDQIDILIDLAGHTSNNRLLVFARKPAPIQVTWLGYPNTTGMRVMDYRLTDAVVDPPGEADRLHAEKLIRLEHGFLCYQTAEQNPPVAPVPCLQQGHVTFGSFNMIRKVTPDVIRIWAQILNAVPDSRLLLKSGALEDEGTKTRLLAAFAEHGIARDRLELINTIPRRRGHLELYSRVDIGLDPFPYNGTTTTFEAMWMGVPVICVLGDRHAGRVGASIMRHVGFPELVAASEQDYVSLAGDLAGNTQRLIELRAALRPQMKRSAMMDAATFTATLEQAYRDMWIRWCNKKR